MADNEQKPASIKITLIGNSGVGKTCIIRSTTGGNYSSKFVEINGQKYQLDLWNTAGHERYRSLTKHFYKDAYIIVLVYDITKQNTFDELKSIWYPNVLQMGEKYTVLAVVGNKSDLFEDEEVKEEEARQYTESIGATFMQVSAKNGDNIDLLFDTLVRKYLGPEFMANLEKLKKEKGEDEGRITLDSKKQKKKKKKMC
jgi:small GTP-binding protein